MAVIRATAVIKSKSPDRRDDFRNVWHFAMDNALASNMLKIGQALGNDFYSALGTYLGLSVDRTLNVHRVDLAEVTPGAPGESDDVTSSLIFSHIFSIVPAAAAVNTLPLECAVALSFRGSLVGLQEEVGITRPRSRRRGRVYIGPLQINSTETSPATGVPVVATAFSTAVLNAYTAARNTWGAGTTPAQHVVYSRADASVAVVNHAHVDNAMDTIRSRGAAATSRAERGF